MRFLFAGLLVSRNVVGVGMGAGWGEEDVDLNGDYGKNKYV